MSWKLNKIEFGPFGKSFSQENQFNNFITMQKPHNAVVKKDTLQEMTSNSDNLVRLNHLCTKSTIDSENVQYSSETYTNTPPVRTIDENEVNLTTRDIEETRYWKWKLMCCFTIKT